MSKTYSLKKYPVSNTSHTIGIPVIVKASLKSRSGLVINARGARSNTYFVSDGDKSSDLTVFHSYALESRGYGQYTFGHTVQMEITDSETGLVSLTAPQKVAFIFTVSDDMRAVDLIQMALAQLGLIYSTVTSGVPDDDTVGALFQGSAAVYP